MPRQFLRDLGVVTGIFLLLIALLTPGILRSRTEARKNSSRNNLKQIGLALHNYHETFGCFPPGGIIREDGTSMHGWMMSIMSFLDANPYTAMVDFNQPWSSPSNITVYGKTIPVYQIPETDMGLTSGGYGVTFYQGNPNLLHRNQCVQLRQIREGGAHNWLVGEVVGNYQPWGYPFNWRPLGTKLCDGPNSFGHAAWDGANLLRADGSVALFSSETSSEILQALADAPPVANNEQTAAPARTFKIGDFYWEHLDLQSDSLGEKIYFVKVLRSPSGMPLSMNVYCKDIVKPEEQSMSKGLGLEFHFLAHIVSGTDIPLALKDRGLLEEATSEQLDANIKLLESIQKQLPKTEAP